jgi:glutamate-1-semialdehyde aminotransferase
MKPNITNSNKLKNRAKKIIPHLTGTFSRAAPNFVEGVYPVYIEKANGCYFTDVDGNEFLDYNAGLGPITLGYNYKPVNNAVIKQLKKGIIFSLPHKIELECSELMCKTIPHADMVKFEKSGSNAVTGAVRAARAITKRDMIAYCGSGGVWHDWQAAMVSRDNGVPSFNRRLLKTFEYNDIEGLEQIFDDYPEKIAAIVLEPTVYEKPKNGFLKKVKKIANNNNSLLILDEVITGFRFDLKGGQRYFDIKGDLVCFGKGMGNGLPISAITGPEEFMRIYDKLWVSSTNNSESLSLAGTIAVINEMKSKKTIQKCWSIGKELFEGWNKISKENNLDSKMTGYAVRMHMECNNENGKNSPELKALILQELIRKGIFMSPSWCAVSYSHSKKDIQKTLETFDSILKMIENNVKNEKYGKLLKGSLPKSVWSIKIKPTKKKIRDRS